MNFRNALLAACDEMEVSELSPRMRSTVKGLRDAPVKHPRLWRVLEHAVAHKYETETGNRVGDWTSVIAWLVKNGPAILKIVMLLLPLFI